MLGAARRLFSRLREDPAALPMMIQWIAGQAPLVTISREGPMYIAGLVIPVPHDKMDAYRAWAENGARIFKEYGCLEIVESWEDMVPDGKQTDFRRAVAAQPGEKIVFTWQVWPDKASFYAAEAKMHEDPRLDSAGEPPFDARRLILGCFEPIFTMGRG